MHKLGSGITAHEVHKVCWMVGDPTRTGVYWRFPVGSAVVDVPQPASHGQLTMAVLWIFLDQTPNHLVIQRPFHSA